MMGLRELPVEIMKLSSFKRKFKKTELLGEWYLIVILYREV